VLCAVVRWPTLSWTDTSSPATPINGVRRHRVCEGTRERRRVLRRGRTVWSAVSCCASPSTEAPRRGRSGRLLPWFDDADRDALPHVCRCRWSCWSCRCCAFCRPCCGCMLCVLCVTFSSIILGHPFPSHPASFCIDFHNYTVIIAVAVLLLFCFLL